MKTKILRKACVNVFVLVGLAVRLAAGTRDGTGFAEVGKALPAAIIVVINTNDSGPGSLRNALGIANDGDTIDATGVSGTILLTSGELQITHNVTINGPGAANLAVNGNASSRVFENFASNVTISGFTITNGHPSTSDSNGGGGILNRGGLTVSGSSIVSNDAGVPIPPDTCNSGGGINTLNGTLTVTNSLISDNIGAGGGISADGATVTVSNSSINGNTGSGGSGGIGCFGTGTLTVMNSTITGNTAGRCGHVIAGSGGGIGYFAGTLTVVNSTISGNSVSGGPYLGGGGVYNGGTLTVTNSTISGNFVYGSINTGYGGGIWNVGNLIVTNSTISANSAPPGQGGAIFNSAGETMIEDTILNAGASGGTIFLAGGTATSLGYNLASDAGGGVLTGPGDQINTDPMLGPLQDNGGPTFTHALLPGSPAIDAGAPNFTPPPFYDQRGPGFPRVVNGRIDKGSFEVQRPKLTATPTPTPTTTATATFTPSPTATPRATPTPKPEPTRRPRPTPAPRP